jgi:DNA-binding response OmpR family regulator
MQSRHVLIVDDEPIVTEVVSTYLEREGIRVTTLSTGHHVVETVESLGPDLIVLDVMLPGGNGFEILREIRRTSDVPIIMLTARTSETDRVSGLEAGADDYVIKPFSPRELAARVKSVLRRSAAEQAALDAPKPPIEFGKYHLDPSARELKSGDTIIELTAREFELLAFLAAAPRQVFSRGQLLEHVWDSSPDWQDPATVTVHIRRIRTKIENDPAKPDHLKTVRGVGYRFEP